MTLDLGEGRIFSHFTNANGVRGITGIDADTLEIGKQEIVNELRFGQGSNNYLASEPGSIFVTELGIDATVGQLNQIGVFGDKQQFIVQFSEETAFANRVRVRGELPTRNIFTIPGGTTLTGKFVITRVR